MVFRIFFQQTSINILHVAQHILFVSFTRAFSKTAIIDQYHIIIIAIKIPGIFGPSFYASRVTMKVEDETSGLFAIKMEPIYSNTRLYIKKIFFEWDIILELKILL